MNEDTYFDTYGDAADNGEFNSAWWDEDNDDAFGHESFDGNEGEE